MDPRGIDLWKEEPESRSPVADFYRGKVVLLTGATGFLGKLYMAKLAQLRVAELIVIVREKKGVRAKERIERLMEKEPVLKIFRENKDNCRSKVTVVQGDIEADRVGLSEEDANHIKERVEIVLHAAADVRFDETLIKAVLANVKGTWEMLNLCVEIRNLKLMVYISTAYANCVHKPAYERFYEPPADPLSILKLVGNLDEYECDIITPMIIRPWPNTYTYAKALAENLIKQFYHRMNMVIVRPSIVATTMFDPIPGWTDNLYGMNGVIVGAGCGILRVLHTADDCNCDVVPADFVVNGTLVAAHRAFERYQTEPRSCDPDKAEIYHLASGVDNPLTNGQIQRFIKTIGEEHPPLKSLWIGTYISTRYARVAMLLTIFLHFFPGIVVDFALRMKGKKSRLMKIYRKVRKFTNFIAFFATQEFVFENSKMRRIFDSMSPGDRAQFQCDMKTITWADFFNVYCPGLKLYMLNEKPSTWEAAKRRYDRLKFVSIVLIKLVLAYVVFVCVRQLIVSTCPYLCQLMQLEPAGTM